jgi:hypothetical protein
MNSDESGSMRDRLARRQFLGCCVGLPLLAAMATSRAAGAAQNCTENEDISDSEQAMRNSLEYTDASADPKKTCGGCQYFMSAGSAECGKCQILNGPANAKGHCTSWTAKA